MARPEGEAERQPGGIEASGNGRGAAVTAGLARSLAANRELAAAANRELPGKCACNGAAMFAPN